MSTTPDDTQWSEKMQASLQQEDLWEQEIVPHLPANLASSACALGALQRKRGITHASQLLRAILYWVLSARSGRQLGVWAVLLGIADICERAWRKRFAKCGEWLLWLLQTTIGESESVLCRGRRVVLVDGTDIQLAGGGAGETGWLVQLLFEVGSGTLIDVRVGDPHQPESVVGLPLQEGDLLIGDRGFTRRTGIVTLARQKVDQLGRWSQTGVRLEQADGRLFEMDGWLAALPQQEVMVETRAWVKEEQESIALRVLALRLPPEQAERARQRVRKRARTRHQTLRESTVVLAGWVILLTTLPPVFEVGEVFWLYRCRWQIERLIKMMKQLLPLIHVGCKTAPLVRTWLLGWLLAWVWSEHAVLEVISQLRTAYLGPEHLQQQYQQMSRVWETEEARLQAAQAESGSLPVARARRSGGRPSKKRAVAQTAPGTTPKRGTEPQYLWSPTCRPLPPSRWQLSHCALDWLHTVVVGQWKWQRLLDCLPQLVRFFCPGKRRRCSQAYQLQVWVLTRFAPLEAGAGFLNLNRA